MNKKTALIPGETSSATHRRDGEAGFCGCNSLFCALFLIAFGAFFLLSNLDVFPWGFYLWRYWPVLLIALGGWLLWKRTTGAPPSRQPGGLG